MAYVPTALADAGHELDAEVRGKRQPMRGRAAAVRAAPLLPRLTPSPLVPLPHRRSRHDRQVHARPRMDQHRGRTTRAVVGITLHAQDALGDVVFVDLPDVGTTFKKGEVAGVVESVKAAADIYMPVAGEVVEVNEALRADPSLANSDPLGDGWFFKIRIERHGRVRRADGPAPAYDALRQERLTDATAATGSRHARCPP